MEKNGRLYFTASEAEDILAGKIPDRIARDWDGEFTIEDLVTILNKQRTRKGDEQ
jgi:hypothetical protein